MRLLLLALFLFQGCARLKEWGVSAPPHEKRFFHVRWAKNLDTGYVPGNLPITYGGVTSQDDVLFVGSLDGIFRAVDAENGRDLWKFQEPKPIAAPGLVQGDFVYYGTQAGRLIVRRTTNGELKYAIDLGAPIEAAPVFHEGRLVVYLRGHQIVCLDAETGKILWNYRRAVPVTVTLQRTTRPLIIGEVIIVGFADGFAGGLSLQEGMLLWEQKLVDTQKFVDVDITPILVDGLAITGSPSGELVGLDPKTGAIRRQYTQTALSNPILRGNTLMFGNAHGEIVYMESDGKVLKEKSISKHGVNQIKWWKEHLMVTTFGGEVLAVDPLSLEVVSRFDLGSSQSAVFGDVALDSSGLGILTSRNRLFFFE